MTQALREAIAAEARTWLGTPYHHHGRIRGVGVDCAQILAAVYGAAGVVQPDLPLGDYPAQWHLHRSDELYLQHLQQLGATPLPDGQAPQLGDIGVWRFGRTFSHGGIVVDTAGPAPLIVHAYLRRGVILSRTDDEPLAGRPVMYWSVLNGR